LVERWAVGSFLTKAVNKSSGDLFSLIRMVVLLVGNTDQLPFCLGRYLLNLNNQQSDLEFHRLTSLKRTSPPEAGLRHFKAG